jgi:hypothetical protein
VVDRSATTARTTTRSRRTPIGRARCWATGSGRPVASERCGVGGPGRRDRVRGRVTCGRSQAGEERPAGCRRIVRPRVGALCARLPGDGRRPMRPGSRVHSGKRGRLPDRAKQPPPGRVEPGLKSAVAGSDVGSIL